MSSWDDEDEISEHFDSASTDDFPSADKTEDKTSKNDESNTEYSFDGFEEEDANPVPVSNMNRQNTQQRQNTYDSYGSGHNNSSATNTGFTSRNQQSDVSGQRRMVGVVGQIPQKQRLYTDLKTISPIRGGNPLHPLGQQQQQQQQQPHVSHRGPLQSYQPQVDTLQTSLALEEIGKEVIKLRNDRMTVFKERLIVANEKKDRALARRLQYENEMKNKTENIGVLESKVASLTSSVDNLKEQIKALQEENSYMKETIDKASQRADKANADLRESSETIRELEQNNANVRHLICISNQYSS